MPETDCWEQLPTSLVSQNRERSVLGVFEYAMTYSANIARTSVFIAAGVPMNAAHCLNGKLARPYAKRIADLQLDNVGGDQHKAVGDHEDFWKDLVDLTATVCDMEKYHSKFGLRS